MSVLTDGGEFARCYKDIYRPVLEFKVEHQGTRASFLDLDLTIFIYKLFDKSYKFPLFIVRIPHMSTMV